MKTLIQNSPKNIKKNKNVLTKIVWYKMLQNIHSSDKKWTANAREDIPKKLTMKHIMIYFRFIPITICQC